MSAFYANNGAKLNEQDLNCYIVMFLLKLMLPSVKMQNSIFLLDFCQIVCTYLLYIVFKLFNILLIKYCYFLYYCFISLLVVNPRKFHI